MIVNSELTKKEIENYVALARTNKCYVEISDIRDTTIGIPVHVSDEFVVFDDKDGFEIDDTNKLGTKPGGAEKIYIRKTIFFRSIRHVGLIPKP